MKFLVDLYRYLILGFSGLMLIGLAFMIAVGFSEGFTNHALGSFWILGILFVLAIVILITGSVGIMISMHDRHNELVQQTERIADVLERLEYSKSDI